MSNSIEVLWKVKLKNSDFLEITIENSPKKATCARCHNPINANEKRVGAILRGGFHSSAEKFHLDCMDIKIIKHEIKLSRTVLEKRIALYKEQLDNLEKQSQLLNTIL